MTLHNDSYVPGRAENGVRRVGVWSSWELVRAVDMLQLHGCILGHQDQMETMQGTGCATGSCGIEDFALETGFGNETAVQSVGRSVAAAEGWWLKYSSQSNTAWPARAVAEIEVGGSLYYYSNLLSVRMVVVVVTLVCNSLRQASFVRAVHGASSLRWMEATLHC